MDIGFHNPVNVFLSWVTAGIKLFQGISAAGEYRFFLISAKIGRIIT